MVWNLLSNYDPRIGSEDDGQVGLLPGTGSGVNPNVGPPYRTGDAPDIGFYVDRGAQAGNAANGMMFNP